MSIGECHDQTTGDKTIMNNISWIDRKEYPFAPHRFEVSAGSLHYVDEGEGQPVVMIHGNPTWSFLYRHLIKSLRSEYRCVAMDHIGFGLSDKPKKWSYFPEDHAINLTQFIEGLELKNVTLAVQDWGGPIGLSYAVSHPKNVSRLIIMNSWAWPVNRDPYYIAFSGFMGGPMGRMLIRRFNFFAKSIMRQAFGDKSKLTTAAHQHYLKALPTPGDRQGCLVFPKRIIDSTPWLDRIWNHISVLRDKPTLIVWGMKDIAFREKELNRWEQAFPDARTVRLESVGHFVQEEAPDQLAEAVAAFLGDTGP